MPFVNEFLQVCKCPCGCRKHMNGDYYGKLSKCAACKNRQHPIGRFPLKKPQSTPHHQQGKF